MTSDASTASTLRTLYFLHIPKTAGTSVRYWLYDLYGKAKWLRAHVVHDLEKLTREEINAYRLYSGHFGYALLDYLDTAPQIITWLREPLARVVSSHYYEVDSYDYLVDQALKYGRHDWVEYYSMVRDTPLAKLCQMRRYRTGSDNLQTRCLAGNWPQCSDRATLCTDEMLEAAKRNLEQMFCFGLCESMDASMDLLCDKLEVPNRQLTSRMNSGKSSSGDRLTLLTDEEVAIIRAANHYDEQLYAFARTLFEQRVREFLDRIAVTPPDLLAIYGQEPMKSAIRQAVAERFRNAA
jgi:hypothetical protein